MSEPFTGVEIRWSLVGAAPGVTGGSARFPLGAVVAIGRDSDNDIVLPDQEVSRKHARLVVRGSDVTFTDLRTSNGSRIDGRRRLGTTPWQPGQILQVGNHLLEIELVVEAPVATAAMTLPSGGAHSQLLARSSDEQDHTPDTAGPAADMAVPSAAGTVASPGSPVNETSTKGQVATDFGQSTKHPERDRAAAGTASVAYMPAQGLTLQDARQRERSPKPASEIAAGPIAVAEAKSDQPPDGAQAGTEGLKFAGPVPAPEMSEIAGLTDAAIDATPLVVRVNGDDAMPADRQERVANPATVLLDGSRQGPIGPSSTSAPEQDPAPDRVEQGRRRDRTRSPLHRPLLAVVVSICLLLFLGAAFYGMYTSAQFPVFSKSAQSPEIRADASPPPTQEPQLRIDPGMHTAVINRTSVNAVCTLMATPSNDKTVRLWRLPEGNLLRTLRPPIGHDNDGLIYATAMPPDGSWIAAGGWDHVTEKQQNQHGVYIFETATGEMLARLGPFSTTVHGLAVSRDGQYLAATFFSQGLRVWKRTRGDSAGVKLPWSSRKKEEGKRWKWQLVAEDSDYSGKETYAATFDHKGVLYTVAYDGKLRRYAPDYTAKPASVVLSGGKLPRSVAVHPSGDRVAVSFIDSSAVEVYGASTLARLFAADGTGVNNGNLGAVAWSGDGSRLYAAGTYQTKDAIKLIRVWEKAGEGSPRELQGGNNTIMDLRACGDGFAVAAADPALGIIAGDDSRRWWQEGVQADMRRKIGAHFTVSADGTRVRFGLKLAGGEPVLFDLANERLVEAPETPQDLYVADTQAQGFSFTGTRFDLKLAGRPIMLKRRERALSVAIEPNKQRFVLGADYSLRAYEMAAATKAPRAWLGVRWKNVDEAMVAKFGLTEARGLVIIGITTPSPADNAGLKEGDIVLQINNEPVVNVEEARRQLSGLSPNDKVTFTIWRAKEQLTISINLGTTPISPIWQKPVPGAPWGVNISRNGKLVVAAYGDGTIRWHRLSDGQELLAFFVHAKDRRWVAWTPKGYYTASAGGENLIGWHVNRSWTEAADFFPAQRFRDRFYRPDVVHQVLQTLDEDKAISEADRLTNSTRQERDILKLLPPVIEVLAPKDGDHFANTEVTIQYSARTTSGQKVDDLDVYLDDQKINKANARGFSPVATSENDTQSVVLSLPRRNVKITLLARSGDKLSEPRSIELKWSGAAMEAKLQRRLLALLIGVSAYSQESLKLNFAHQDAVNLAEALKAQEGKAFVKVEANVLLNADSTGIRKGFDWLNSNAQDGDLTLILLSGHGTTRNNTFYFLPADADPNNLSATGISGHEIVGTIQGLPGGKLLLIDACRAGGGLTPVGMSQVPVDMNKLANDMGQPVGAIFFGSSTAGELSYEDSKLKAGVFTATIVEGLRGRADLNGDGKVETDEMLVWLRKRVPELTEDRQHPLRHQSAPVEYTISGR